MKIKAFSQWLQTFQHQALMLNERRFIMLKGEDAWAKTLLESAHLLPLAEALSSRCFIYGDSQLLQANISLKRFRDKLGSESDYVIFADSQFNIDAFAALSGTLVAGGIFFLVIGDKQLEVSPFLQRLYRFIQADDAHIIIEQTQSKLRSLPADNLVTEKLSTEQFAYGCVTQEQVCAVEAIIKVLKGKRKRPLVLTADRGRGKSSALAIACVHLLNNATKENPLHIVVTVADYNSLQVFYKQLSLSSPSITIHHNKCEFEYGCIEYIAVDQLLKQEIKASLLLVDEAAAIPVYLLEKLMLKYHRMVFASTVHGYEGAGRGFTLKFTQKLDDNFPKWQYMHIRQPVRYREDDPVERLVFQTCLLDADIKPLSLLKNDTSNLALSSLSFQHLDTPSLINDEVLLKQIVSVLVTAHYQTKPSDIKMLLDDPNIQIVCLMSEHAVGSDVVAVALLLGEGQLAQQQVNEAQLMAVQHSQKRLKGHFTPQSLLTQCGFEQAFDFSYLRVMRIAVHVQWQQQGIGSYFLDQIAHFAQSQQADILSSSFGATQQLLSFWLQKEYQLARIGFTKDKASGEHSALVLKALTDRACSFEVEVNHDFYRSFDYLLAKEYRYLSADLIALVIQHYPKMLQQALTTRDVENVQAFANGYRQFSCCAFSLQLWLKQHLVQSSYLPSNEKEALIQRILQRHNIDELCQQQALTGKKALDKFIRTSIKSLTLQ